MSASTLLPSDRKPPRTGDPAWVVARFYPAQGDWTEADFARLPDNRGLELVDGVIEELPMPSLAHQRILLWVFDLIRQHIHGRIGAEVFFSGYPALIRPRTLREPDVLLVLDEHAHGKLSNYTRHVDLAVEIVSPDDPDRDYVDKRADYAQAGIREYWIVDPKLELLTVLKLEGQAYREAGVFRRGDVFASLLLPDLHVNVEQVFAAADGPR